MRNTLLRVVLASFAFGVGCVTTAGEKLSDVQPDVPAVAPAIEQTVGDFSFHLDGGKLLTSNKMGRELNDEILNRWVAAGFIEGHTYVPASRFGDTAAFRLTLEGNQDGESSLLLQILSGLTLYVIPHYVDTKLALTYVLENAATGCSFRASVEDSYNTVISLLLLPATPFTRAGRETTFARIADNLYLQLLRQGAFGASRGCEGSG